MQYNLCKWGTIERATSSTSHSHDEDQVSLDSQVAAKLTVQLYSVVQLCMTHCLPGCACIVSGVWRLQYDLCKWGTSVLLYPHHALFQVWAFLTYSTHFGRYTHSLSSSGLTSTHLCVHFCELLGQRNLIL